MVTMLSVSALPPTHIHRVEDPATGLSGIIAIHSTSLGPAAGGCRFWRYDSVEEVVRDAARLAEGMSYKNAIAGLPLGGGKAVLRVPERPFDRAEMFAAFGRAVRSLDGLYVTAEDVGTGVADMEAVATTTRHVAGLPPRPGCPGGDPSLWTARGVFEAMRVASELHLGRPVSECTVAVQGLGHVGSALARLLHDAGAKLIISDPKHGVAAQVAMTLGTADIMSKDHIIEARADIFAPCALGGVLDGKAVSRLKAKLVCGAANNQLADEQIADKLAQRGILYAPDYVVNAGGIINVAAEYLGWGEREVEKRVDGTGARLRLVLDEASRRGITPHAAAETLARGIISKGPAGGEVAAAA
jgi:leucine dehydrogenase